MIVLLFLIRQKEMVDENKEVEDPSCGENPKISDQPTLNLKRFWMINTNIFDGGLSHYWKK